MSSQNNTSLLRIGIDGNEANVAHRVGSNVYAFELLKHIELLTRELPNYQFTIFTSEKQLPDMPSERTGWTYSLIPPGKFATQWALPLALFKMRKQLDLFFTPGHYAPRLCPIPYISCVMDLAFLYFPKQFKVKDYWQLKLWTKYSVKKAKHIIGISEWTKQDIQTQYGIKPEKISVVYPAANILPFKKENQKVRQEVLYRFGIHNPYILYVGTLQPRKNLEKLVEAFEHLTLRYEGELNKAHAEQAKTKRKKKGTEPKQEKVIQLVIAGKQGWLSQPILDRIQRSPFKSRIVLTGFVTEEEKSIVYRSALCSTLIGLHEGFGMPALESLQYAVVPVVSNRTSLPEVVGDAGVLVNPEDPTSIMRGLDQAIRLNQKDRKGFVKRAQQQVQKFSWTVSAEKLLEIFQQVSQKS